MTKSEYVRMKHAGSFAESVAIVLPNPATLSIFIKNSDILINITTEFRWCCNVSHCSTDCIVKSVCTYASQSVNSGEMFDMSACVQGKRVLVLSFIHFIRSCHPSLHSFVDTRVVDMAMKEESFSCETFHSPHFESFNKRVTRDCEGEVRWGLRYSPCPTLVRVLAPLVPTPFTQPDQPQRMYSSLSQPRSSTSQPDTKDKP